MVTRVQALERLSDPELQSLIYESANAMALSKALKIQGRYYKYLKARLASGCFDTSHWEENWRSSVERSAAIRGHIKASEKRVANARENLISLLPRIFVQQSEFDGKFVRKLISRWNPEFCWLEYKCQIPECGNLGQHAGKPLRLQIDHINGDSRDHRLVNLRYLCPNCHAQTETFTGKNVRKRRELRLEAVGAN